MFCKTATAEVLLVKTIIQSEKDLLLSCCLITVFGLKTSFGAPCTLFAGL